MQSALGLVVFVVYILVIVSFGGRHHVGRGPAHAGQEARHRGEDVEPHGRGSGQIQFTPAATC